MRNFDKAKRIVVKIGTNILTKNVGGVEGLLIYKWKLIGTGQIVADYVGPDAKKFTHKKLSGGCEC